MESSLTDLPAELIPRIVAGGDIRNVFDFSRSCRFIKEALAGDIVWKTAAKKLWPLVPDSVYGGWRRFVYDVLSIELKFFDDTGKDFFTRKAEERYRDLNATECTELGLRLWFSMFRHAAACWLTHAVEVDRSDHRAGAFAVLLLLELQMFPKARAVLSGAFIRYENRLQDRLFLLESYVDSAERSYSFEQVLNMYQDVTSNVLAEHRRAVNDEAAALPAASLLGRLIVRVVDPTEHVRVEDIALAEAQADHLSRLFLLVQRGIGMEFIYERSLLELVGDRAQVAMPALLELCRQAKEAVEAFTAAIESFEEAGVSHLRLSSLLSNIFQMSVRFEGMLPYAEDLATPGEPNIFSKFELDPHLIQSLSLAHAEQALECNPHHAAVHSAIGYRMMAVGEMASAAYHFVEALSMIRTEDDVAELEAGDAEDGADGGARSFAEPSGRGLALGGPPPPMPHRMAGQYYGSLRPAHSRAASRDAAAGDLSVFLATRTRNGETRPQSRYRVRNANRVRKDEHMRYQAPGQLYYSLRETFSNTLDSCTLTFSARVLSLLRIGQVKAAAAATSTVSAARPEEQLAPEVAAIAEYLSPEPLGHFHIPLVANVAERHSLTLSLATCQIQLELFDEADTTLQTLIPYEARPRPARHAAAMPSAMRMPAPMRFADATSSPGSRSQQLGFSEYLESPFLPGRQSSSEWRRQRAPSRGGEPSPATQGGGGAATFSRKLKQIWSRSAPDPERTAPENLARGYALMALNEVKRIFKARGAAPTVFENPNLVARLFVSEVSAVDLLVAEKEYLEKCIDKARSLGPDLVAVLFMCADVYERIGDIRKSTKLYLLAASRIRQQARIALAQCRPERCLYLAAYFRSVALLSLSGFGSQGSNVLARLCENRRIYVSGPALLGRVGALVALGVREEGSWGLTCIASTILAGVRRTLAGLRAAPAASSLARTGEACALWEGVGAHLGPEDKQEIGFVLRDSLAVAAVLGFIGVQVEPENGFNWLLLSEILLETLDFRRMRLLPQDPRQSKGFLTSVYYCCDQDSQKTCFCPSRPLPHVDESSFQGTGLENLAFTTRLGHLVSVCMRVNAQDLREDDVFQLSPVGPDLQSRFNPDLASTEDFYDSMAAAGSRGDVRSPPRLFQDEHNMMSFPDLALTSPLYKHQAAAKHRTGADRMVSSEDLSRDAKSGSECTAQELIESSDERFLSELCEAIGGAQLCLTVGIIDRSPVKAAGAAADPFPRRPTFGNMEMIFDNTTNRSWSEVLLYKLDMRSSMTAAKVTWCRVVAAFGHLCAISNTGFRAKEFSEQIQQALSSCAMLIREPLFGSSVSYVCGELRRSLNDQQQMSRWMAHSAVVLEASAIALNKTMLQRGEEEASSVPASELTPVASRDANLGSSRFDTTVSSIIGGPIYTYLRTAGEERARMYQDLRLHERLLEYAFEAKLLGEEFVAVTGGRFGDPGRELDDLRDIAIESVAVVLARLPAVDHGRNQVAWRSWELLRSIVDSLPAGREAAAAGSAPAAVSHVSQQTLFAGKVLLLSLAFHAAHARTYLYLAKLSFGGLNTHDLISGESASAPMSARQRLSDCIDWLALALSLEARGRTEASAVLEALRFGTFVVLPSAAQAFSYVASRLRTFLVDALASLSAEIVTRVVALESGRADSVVPASQRQGKVTDVARRLGWAVILFLRLADVEGSDRGDFVLATDDSDSFCVCLALLEKLGHFVSAASARQFFEASPSGKGEKSPLTSPQTLALFYNTTLLLYLVLTSEGLQGMRSEVGEVWALQMESFAGILGSFLAKIARKSDLFSKSVSWLVSGRLEKGFRTRKQFADVVPSGVFDMELAGEDYIVRFQHFFGYTISQSPQYLLRKVALKPRRGNECPF